jgi:hypothetical protein
MTATEAETTRKDRDVKYGQDVVLDELPDVEIERRSPLRDKLAEITGDPSMHGKWHMVASYGNKTGAASAAGTLRNKYGNTQSAMGWAFKPIPYEDAESGQIRNSLFASYNPAAITEEGAAAWSKKVKERDAKAKAKAKAAAANGG